jgi:7-cyano-7-deazaguanine synthase in queuosine biosynthesis
VFTANHEGSKYDSPRVAFNFDTVLYTDGKPRYEMIQQAQVLSGMNVYIVVYSDSSTLGFERVKSICKKYEIPYNQIVMSAYPAADVHIDSPGFYPGNMLIDYILLKFVYGDSYQYLTNPSGGLETYSELNKISYRTKEFDGVLKSDVSASNFRVYIPFSGGLDSTTLVCMAAESGYDFQAYYVDMGQDVAKKEWATVQNIASEYHFSDRLQLKTVRECKFLQSKHILFNRNTVIVLELAREMLRNGHTGEIWFGVTSGESPVLGGDKSREWLSAINRLLHLLQLPAQVTCPVVNLDKSDEIVWLFNHCPGIFELTDSCFDPEKQNCGKCRSCFRKFLALAKATTYLNEYDEVDSSQLVATFNSKSYSDSIADLLPFAKEYYAAMTDMNSDVYYSPYRKEYTLDLISDIFMGNDGRFIGEAS